MTLIQHINFKLSQIFLGVMVTVVRNGIDDSSSNLARYCLNSTYCYYLFHILGKLCIQLFSLQLWVNCSVDLALYPWYGKENSEFKPVELWPSRLGLLNTPTASLQRSKTPTTGVLDMTLNNLMVRFHLCWSFGECGVSRHCHRS